ncbi:MAG: MATE family efflux transporter [Gammaproteobacteria bacterium]|nr:MATE family efflux transporter [Gammaproteobacteria bacterium]
MKNLSHKHVWILAAPIIISNISVPLVGAVDTAVVGHLTRPDYIGAVALGAIIFSFLYWGFGFLRMGTTGFVARAYGAEDTEELSRITLRVLFLGVAIGLLIILLGHPLIRLALNWLQSEASVERLAESYSIIRIWSAPATLMIYVFTGIFIGLHNTRLAFVLQIVLNLTNIGLDLLFVPVLELGVQGVAWATLIAEYTAALTGIFLLRKRLAAAFATVKWSEIFAWQAIRELMKTNGDIFIRTLCLVFSFAFFTAQSAKMGTVVLAANTVLIHLQSIMAYGLDGFAHSAEALAGSAYGARDRARFSRAVKLTTLWSGLMAVAVSVAYWIFGSQNAMILSSVGYLLLVFWLQPIWGNHGLFLALSGFMVLRTLTLGAYYPSILRSIDRDNQ